MCRRLIAATGRWLTIAVLMSVCAAQLSLKKSKNEGMPVSMGKMDSFLSANAVKSAGKPDGWNEMLQRDKEKMNDVIGSHQLHTPSVLIGEDTKEQEDAIMAQILDSMSKTDDVKPGGEELLISEGEMRNSAGDGVDIELPALDDDEEVDALLGKHQLDGEVETVEQPQDEQLPANDQSTVFAHSVADGNAMEELTRMAGESHTNGEDANAEIESSNTPQTTGEISWETPEVFHMPLTISAETKLGDEILSVRAHDVLGNSLEFVCYRPEIVFCLTDSFSANTYQLRVVYSSESKASNFDLPFSVVVKSSLNDATSQESVYENRNFTIQFVASDETSATGMQSSTVAFEQPSSTISLTDFPASDEPGLLTNDGTTASLQDISTDSMGTVTPTTLEHRDRSEVITTPLTTTIESEENISSMTTASEDLMSTTPPSVTTSGSLQVTSTETSTTTDELDEFARVTPIRITQRTTIANLVVSSNKNGNEIKGPMLEFMPHFEHESYDLFIPAGKNENTTFVGMIYFIALPGTAAPSFEIVFDRLKWFELDDIITEQNSNRLISTLRIMLREGVNIDPAQTSNGFYKFSVRAKQAEFQMLANVKTEIMSFDAKPTTAPSETAESSTGKEVSTIVPIDVIDESESAATEVIHDSDNALAHNADSSSSTPFIDDAPIGSDEESTPLVETAMNAALTTDSIRLEAESTESEAESTIIEAEYTQSTTPSPEEIGLSNEITTLQTTKVQDGQGDTTPLPDSREEDADSLETTLAVNPPDESEDDMDRSAVTQVEEGQTTLDIAHVVTITMQSMTSQGNSENEEVETTQTSDGEETLKTEVDDETVVESNEEVTPNPLAENTFDATVATEETTRRVQEIDEMPDVVDDMQTIAVETMAGGTTVGDTEAATETVNDDETESTTGIDALVSIATPTAPTEPGSEQLPVERPVDSVDGQRIVTNENSVPAPDSTIHAKVYSTELQMEFKMPRKGGLAVSEGLRDGTVVPGFAIIVTAKEMDPHDVITLTVNSTAFDVIPHQMQPGKTVFLSVKDNSQLDFETPPQVFTIAISASMRSRPWIAATRSVVVVKGDVSDIAPAFTSSGYDFHVYESSITGQKVGQMEVDDGDQGDSDHLAFRLIGPGSDLFAISGGTISVACPSALPCLDREDTDSYHLLAVATDRGGLNSVPASVRIFIDDRNDNGPSIHLTQNEIEISDGRFVRPLAVKIRDSDMNPFNVNDVSTDGNASTFISVDRVRDDLYMARLSSMPTAGQYQLEITVRDPAGLNPPDTALVQVNVLNTITKAHFERARYERTVNSEKLHKGNPLVQPKFEGAPTEDVRFVTIRDDPGWLLIDEYTGNLFVGDVPSEGVSSGKYDVSIAAVNRTDGRVLSETVFSLTVLSGSRVTTVFHHKLLTKVFRKDPAMAHLSMNLLSSDDKSPVSVLRESITAVDEKLHEVSIDKSAISLSNGNVLFEMNKLQNVRSLEFQVASDENSNDTASIVVYLSSDPEEVAARNRELSRPKFIHPWKTDLNIISIQLAEENPQGHTLISLPAYNPLNGESITDLRLSGDMSPFFTVDRQSGDVKIVRPLDYETMEPSNRIFDMVLTAGEEPYESLARLRVHLVDMDDNAPGLAPLTGYDLNNLTIAENSRPGTILFKLHISDADFLNGKRDVFKYSLSGEGAANFQVREVNDTVAVIVSPAADLDHEKSKEMLISIRVEDSGGNSDSTTAIVRVTDTNDNAPAFVPREYRSETVENWPVGTVITMVHAEDRDDGDNGRVQYTLSKNDGKYFEIDGETGIVRTARPLIGLARAQPYELRVTATDKGVPALSSTTVMTVRVIESTSLSRPGDDKDIHIFAPPVDFMLDLDENTPANQRVYKVQARIGGFNDQFEREIQYSITPVDNATDGGWFTIDSSSGHIFTLRQLDYEQRPAITLRVTAQNALIPERTASRLLRVKINDLDDNLPSFSEVDGSLRGVFIIGGEGVPLDGIATLHADDLDTEPYNSIYYYLLPSCSNRDGKFTMDKLTAMVTVVGSTPLDKEEYNLCAFASAYDLTSPPEIAFDNKNESMLTFTVEVSSLKRARNLERQPEMNFPNNTVITFGEGFCPSVAITVDSSDRSLNYHLNQVTFTPSEASDGSAARKDYFSVDAFDGDVRVDPAMIDDVEGVFGINVAVSQNPGTFSIADIVTQVHNVRSSTRLKFVFDQNADVMSLNLDEFKTRLNNALGMDPSTSQLSVVVGKPNSHAENAKNRSSVCFHALRNAQIMSQESAVSALSATMNGESTLSRLYQAFRVVNIEACSELERTLSAGVVISRATLFWVGVSLLGSLILVSFCIYSCFIVRYKDYLNERTAEMSGSDLSSIREDAPISQVQFYNIGNLPKMER